MFAQPQWLFLLLATPLLALVAFVVGLSHRKRWTPFVADRLRKTLIKGDNPLPRWLSLAALLVGFTLLVIALARPYAISGTQSEKIRSRNILIALDLSRSMRVSDVKPDRLSQAKIIAYELMDAMPTERIGVIGFAGQACLCAPLTIDHSAVRETISQLDEGWIPLGGSNLTEAVELAATTLKQTGQRNNALIILSDGEKHEDSLDDAIASANATGMYVITIGIGTEDGDYVPNKQFPNNRMVDRNGKPVISRLQPDALRRLASETNGRFAIAGSGTNIAGLVKDAIKDLDTFETKGTQKEVRTEFFQWFTLPAVFCLIFSAILGTRWRKIIPRTATAALVIGTVGTARAQDADDALEALQAGRFERAASYYKQLAENSRTGKRRTGFRLGEAEANYRNGNFTKARSAYSKALLSPSSEITWEAHTGVANTLFQLGWKNLSRQPHSKSAQTMEDFDRRIRTILRHRLENPDTGISPSNRIQRIVQHWTDAVRHYETVLAEKPEHPIANQNRDLTVRYLNRIKELLEEETKRTQDMMPQDNGPEDPDPDGDPQENGDGEPGDEEGEGGDNEAEDRKNGEDGDKKDWDGENDGSKRIRPARIRMNPAREKAQKTGHEGNCVKMRIPRQAQSVQARSNG